VAYPQAGSQSICDRYSKALMVTNRVLLDKIVNGTVGALVANGAITKKYFDGTKPAGSTNFLTNPVALAALKGSLANFFWGPLGCTDRPARNYTGGSMKAVHSAMGISTAEFNFFETALLGVLKKAGVAQNDLNSVQAVLETTRSSIVAAPTTQSICDKYTAPPMTNAQLLKALMLGIVGQVTARGAPTLKYFDGTKPRGSTNFTSPANSAALSALVDSLVNFFWAPLGCSDQPPRVYSGSTMKIVHASMGINLTEFNFFVAAVAKVMLTNGVSNADSATITGVLNSFQRDIVTGRGN